MIVEGDQLFHKRTVSQTPATSLGAIVGYVLAVLIVVVCAYAISTRQWNTIRLSLRSIRTASIVILTTTSRRVQAVLSRRGSRKPQRWRQPGLSLDGTSLPLHNLASDAAKLGAVSILLPKMPIKAVLHLPLEAVTPAPPHPSPSAAPPPALIFAPNTRRPLAFKSFLPAKYHEPICTQLHSSAVVFDCSVPPPTFCHQPSHPLQIYSGIEARLSQDASRPISPPFSPIRSALQEDSLSAPETILRRESLRLAVDQTRHLRLNPGRLMYAENHPRSRGPSGEVWLGKLYDVQLSSDSYQEVAVKVIWLKPQEDHSSRRLLRHLLREVVPWYGLDHPNIVTFIGYDFDASSARMVSDWQFNGNALQYVKKNPTVDRLSLIMQVAQGLAYLHAREPIIIHGDIKPENMLIDDNGVAKLGDFGLSIVIDDAFSHGLRSSSGYCGTLRYSDPVLLDDQPRSVYTDLWALGWLCFELTTLRRPYDHRQSDRAVVRAVIEYDVPSRDKPGFDIPDGDVVWPILDASWARENEQRWSAEKIARHLREAVRV